MTSPFERFISFVSTDHQTDYWYDSAMDEAIDLLKDFTSDDWEKLSNQWQEHTAEIQVKIIDSLSGTENAMARLVQEEILNKTSDSAVARWAMKHLAAAAQSGYAPDKKILPALNALLAGPGGAADKDQIESLIASIK